MRPITALAMHQFYRPEFPSPEQQPRQRKPGLLRSLFGGSKQPSNRAPRQYPTGRVPMQYVSNRALIGNAQGRPPLPDMRAFPGVSNRLPRGVRGTYAQLVQRPVGQPMVVQPFERNPMVLPDGRPLGRALRPGDTVFDSRTGQRFDWRGIPITTVPAQRRFSEQQPVPRQRFLTGNKPKKPDKWRSRFDREAEILLGSWAEKT